MTSINKLFRTLLESCLSIVPIIVIILILSFSNLAPIIGGYDYALLIIGAVVLVLGLSVFSIGSSRSLSKVGEHMGSSLSKQNKLWIVVIVAVLLGALVTCAEPSIMILSSQTPLPSWSLILFISLGVGLFVAIGVIRTIKHQSLNLWLLGLYGLIFALAILIDNKQFMPLIWDTSGATTGSATVPFLLSLGAGVAMVRGGKKSQQESFGLIAIASIGPLLMMIILILFVQNGTTNYTGDSIVALSNDSNIWKRFQDQLLPTFNSDGSIGAYGTMLEVAMALAPIMIVFFIYQAIYIKLPKQEIKRILFGFLFAFVGLVLFLTAIKAAMMPFGKFVGEHLGLSQPWLIVLICFLIGLVTIVCEPATHVLTKQIEKVSDGGITKASVIMTLSIGVGLSIGLCGIRAIYKFDILYYIVPGYIIALGLTFVCPPLYTALAFDSGGVASGPMTVSFVLPMITGIVVVTTPAGQDPNVMGNAFGVIAMVAMAPLIGIQILGVGERVKKAYRFSVYKQRYMLFNDNEVIHFRVGD